MSRNLQRAFVLLACLAPLATCLVGAQEEPPPEEYSGSGTIEKVEPGWISLKDSTTNKVVEVKLAPLVKLTVVGTAEPTFLKSGMWVRFTAELNKRGAAQGEVSQLSVIEISDIVQPGIQADVLPEEDLNKRKTPIPYLIVGQVKSARGRSLQVVTPDQAIKARLAEAVQIDVDSTNYGLALPGDEVTVLGKVMRNGQILGDKVDIKLVNPLTGKKRKPVKVKKEPVKREARRSAASKKANAEAEVPASGAVGDPAGADKKTPDAAGDPADKPKG